MDFFEVVKKRASYRGPYKDQKVPDEDIRKILQAGIDAPSGMNFQGVSFIGVKDPEVLKKISEVISTPATQTAPLIVVITQKLSGPLVYGMSFNVEDYGAATENVWLAITALGYAGVWMDGMTKAGDNADKIKKILGIEDETIIKTIIPVGVPEKEPVPSEKKKFEERACII